MKRFALIVLVLILANTAYAETWLCISETSTGVTTKAPFKLAEFQAGEKYLITVKDDTEEIEFKQFGGVVDSFAKCANYSTAIICKYTGIVTGFEFSMSRDDLSFYMYDLTQASDGLTWALVSSGKCSTI
jgi:hypothetical protein